MEKIIIIGTEKEAESFLYEHRGKYEVVLFIDEYPRRHSFRGISVVSLESITSYFPVEYKIVIATSIEKYIHIARTLTKCHLVEFQDFFYYEALNKKLSIFFGNCQCKAMEFYMEQIPEFRSEYWVYPYPPIDQNNSYYVSVELIKHCSLFVYQDIKQESNGILNSSAYFLEHLPKNACAIKMPNLYKQGFGFFPQAFNKRIALMRETEHLFVVNADNHDSIITKLHKEGYTIEEIVNKLNSDEVLDKQEVLDSFDAYMNRIKKMDESWDIKIYNFIKENYKRKCIFTDPGHISNEVYREYIMQLIQIIGIHTMCDVEKVLDKHKHTFDMPIYPCVARYVLVKQNCNTSV